MCGVLFEKYKKLYLKKINLENTNNYLVLKKTVDERRGRIYYFKNKFLDTIYLVYNFKETSLSYEEQNR